VKAVDALSVLCPVCDREEGQPCVTKTGAPFRGVHARRGDRAKLVRSHEKEQKS
jgi:hypothetical protein